MPYEKISQLPQQVQNVLPQHAQEIYLASFNSAYEQYSDPSSRDSPKEDLEVVCHKVAWSAVKAKFHKADDGSWTDN